MDLETLIGKARLAFNEEMAKVSGIYMQSCTRHNFVAWDKNHMQLQRMGECVFA